MRKFLLLLAACGGSSNPAVDAPKSPIDSEKPIDSTPVTPDAPADAAIVVDAPPADITMNLAGGGNALLWDATGKTLYLTDGTANKLVKWTDAGGFADVATLPTEASGISLGDMIKQADGSILITNFGFGTTGDLIKVTGSTAVDTTGFVANRRRIGLAQDSTGKIYESYFVGGGGGAQTGGAATVTLAATVGVETEIVPATAGLKKLVGTAVTADGHTLYLSDQSQKKIVKVDLVNGNTVSDLATVTTADLLVMMPNGDLLTGGGATIERITPAGVVTTLPNTGFETVHGMAYDAEGKRLFIVDHSATVGTPDKLHIQPLAN